MRELNFGSIDAPADWVVNASVNVVGPAIDLSADLHVGKSQPMHPNINVTVSTLARTDITAEQLRTDQRKTLSGELPGFKVADEGSLDGPDGPVPYLAYTFDLNGLLVRQVQVLHVAGNKVHYVTATAPEAMFKRMGDELTGVLASYRPGSAA